MAWGDGKISRFGRGRTWVLACVLTLPSQARADNVLSAEELRDACTRPNEVWASFCHGYAQATADFADMSDLACVPDGTTPTDIVSGVDELAFDKIASGEISRDIPAFAVTMSVLQTLYPCETDGEASE